jgi:hypothetical protein
MGRARKSPPAPDFPVREMTATAEPGNVAVTLGGRMSVLDWVDVAVVADGMQRLSLPHVVHLLDHSSGLASVFGPFEDPVDALGFADQLISALTDATPAGFAATVLALEPPD